MTEYFCATLENGLRVVSVPCPHHHGAEVLVYLGVGSRHEPAHQAGISHLLEHMLFKGTRDYASAIDLERAFEAAGGSANAATDTETTCYHSRIHPEHLREGIGLFASMLRRPLFKDLEVERRVILEEALSDINEAGRQINPDNLVAALIFPAHPLGRPTVGSMRCIERLTLAQLRNYHAAFYGPANAVLAVAGPLEFAEVLAAAREHFADWHGTPPPAPRPWTSPGGAGPRFTWCAMPAHRSVCNWHFNSPAATVRMPSICALSAGCSVGGDEPADAAVARRAGLDLCGRGGSGVVCRRRRAGSRSGSFTDNLVAAVEALLAVFHDLVANAVTADELAHVLATYRYDLDYSRDHLEELALRYAWGELTGSRRTIAGDLAELASVTPAGLQQTAQAFFAPAHLYGAVVGPYGRAAAGLSKR